MAPPIHCPSCTGLVARGAKSCRTCGVALIRPVRATLDVVEFVVLGQPIPQGSMKSVGKGRMVSDNPELKPWRTRVNLAAREACGHGWAAWDGAVGLDVVFTLKRPASAPKTKVIYPATKPDLDKLTRAIGDSLCPKDGFRLIAEDSRIVEFGWNAKTYPKPMNTHPGALDTPGVRVRVRRLDAAVLSKPA